MPQLVSHRRSAKDESTPMDDAQISLVVEAMYRVAADPDQWQQLIEALGDAPEREAPPPAAARALAHSEEIARLVHRPDDPKPTPPPTPGVGWIVLTARRKIAAANDAAISILHAGLGAGRPGEALQFHHPENDEALTRALAQLRKSGEAQTILKLERDGEEGPCFAYLASTRTLRDLIQADIADIATDDQSCAIVFPAVEETGRLWVSIRDSFGLTPAEIRLASRLRDGRTLKEASDELDVSINTVRNQLRAIFDKMGLKRQSELIRALAELAQIGAAIGAQDLGLQPVLADAPPIRSVVLRDGRNLAYREYGVSDGRALLLFHEGLGSSLLPAGAQALASKLDLRAISIERPGFGQSDPRDDYSFDNVAEDVVDLCDQLGLQDIHISAILSGAPSAIQTAIRLGPRARRILICSGRPPRPTTRAGNLMTTFRARLESNPWIVDTFYGILRARLTPALVERMIRSGSTLSPNDRAFVEANPWAAEFTAAYVAESLAKTSRGAADEVKAFRRAGNLTPAALTCPLVVWHGQDDQFAPLADLLEYLGDKPSEIRIIPDIGHLLAMKHWDEMMRFAAS
jgi:pimeloyl-ACP methyl ester carboxylesterase/DNA-binding CsgD family transcriptional regulator